MSLDKKTKEIDDSLFHLETLELEEGELDDPVVKDSLNKLYSSEFRKYKRFRNLQNKATYKQKLNSGEIEIVIPVATLEPGQTLMDENGDPITNENGVPLTHEEAQELINQNSPRISKKTLDQLKVIEGMKADLDALATSNIPELVNHLREVLNQEISKANHTGYIFNTLTTFAKTFKTVPIRRTVYDKLSEEEIIKKIYGTSLKKEFSPNKLSDCYTVLHSIRKSRSATPFNIINEVTIGSPRLRLSGAAGFIAPKLKDLTKDDLTQTPDDINKHNQIFNVISKAFGADGSDSKENKNLVDFSLVLGDPYTYLHKMSFYTSKNLAILNMETFLHETRHEKQFCDFIQYFRSPNGTNKVSQAEGCIALIGLFSCYNVPKVRVDYNVDLSEMDAFTTSIIELKKYIDKGYIKPTIEEKISLYDELIYHLQTYKSKDIYDVIANQLMQLSHELAMVLNVPEESIISTEEIKLTIKFFHNNFEKYDNIRKELEKDLIAYVQPIDDFIADHSIKYDTNKTKNFDKKLQNDNTYDPVRCYRLCNLANEKLSKQVIQSWKKDDQESDLEDTL